MPFIPENEQAEPGHAVAVSGPLAGDDFMNFGNDEPFNPAHSFDPAPFRLESDLLSNAGRRSVVSLEPEAGPAEADQLDDQLNSGTAEQYQQIITPDEQPGQEIPEEAFSSSEAPSSPAAAPVADMEISEGDVADDELIDPEELPAAAASAKKRGRPAGKTAAKAKTNGTASKATSGRKREAEEEPEEEEATPVKRARGRPARSAAAIASARLAAKSAKKPKAGRPKGSGTSVPKGTTNPKRGGPKSASKKDDSSNTEVVPKGEYEVEEILESVIDADNFKHMYRVKWKGYGVDEATWEPKTNLTHAADLIAAFDSNKAKQTSQPRAAAAASKAAPKAAAVSKSKSKVVKPGRPAGRPKKAVKPVAVKKAAGCPAGRPAGRGVGRSKRKIS